MGDLDLAGSMRSFGAFLFSPLDKHAPMKIVMIKPWPAFSKPSSKKGEEER